MVLGDDEKKVEFIFLAGILSFVIEESELKNSTTFSAVHQISSQLG